jgi:ubiquinone/menaquinone biosynthesis C-methylase UbiE
LDFITTFDSIHNQADPAAVLRGIARSLNPGGSYLCVDIAASSDVADNATHPAGPFLYTFSSVIDLKRVDGDFINNYYICKAG